jgi:hypothetical protein
LEYPQRAVIPQTTRIAISIQFIKPQKYARDKS